LQYKLIIVVIYASVAVFSPSAFAQTGIADTSQVLSDTIADPAKILVDRLDLERYKATIKSLTKFGDRRQGTDRNRAAINWIEAQLRTYGCADIARLQYTYQPPSPDLRTTGPNNAGGPGAPTPADATAVGGGRPRSTAPK
jgi:hypothetical protein